MFHKNNAYGDNPPFQPGTGFDAEQSGSKDVRPPDIPAPHAQSLIWTADLEYPVVKPPYPLQAPASSNDKQNPPFRKKAFLKKAVSLTGFLLLAVFCGFGGNILSDFVFQNSSSSSAKVIYQSVQRTSAETASGASLSVAEIAELTASSVVEITTETVTTGQRMEQYISEGAGSGVIITTDGYIVTNNHVIADASKITVRQKDGTTSAATLIGTDAKTDIAVIKIDASNLAAAVFGDSGSLKVGELAVAIGNPLGELGGTVTDGIISALDREIAIDGETMSLLQTSTAINPGNSGGGLFNSNAELIGIVNAKSSGSDVEGLGFAIPINTAKSVIEQLMTNGYVQGRIDLGMTLVDITDAQTAMTYRVQTLGVYILKVSAGTGADAAGFSSGDCIRSIDGKSVSSSSDVNAVLDSHSVGDTVSITVLRNGQTRSLSLTLTEYIPAE